MTLDILADGIVSKPGWGTNFGTSFATPKVAAETLNHINAYISELNLSGSSLSTSRQKFLNLIIASSSIQSSTLFLLMSTQPLTFMGRKLVTR